MKPKDPNKPAVPPRRAAIRIGVDARAGSHIFGPGGRYYFRTRDGLLSFLTSPNAPRSFSQLWLSPHSPGDWGEVIVPLARLGWVLGVTRRRGQFSSLFVYKPGSPVPSEGVEMGDGEAGGDGTTPAGRIWSGRSAAGLIDVPSNLSPIDECEAVLLRVEAIDQAIRQRYPAVSLGTSLTATAIAIFRTMLDHELSVDPQVEVSLRHGGSVGGGRQELFVEPGSTFSAAEVVCPRTGQVSLDDAPCDLDLRSAYPTSLERVPVGAEFVGLGGQSSCFDACTISLALVDVPSTLLAAPLRYEPTDGSASCYPTGLVFGAWSSTQLKVAEKLGASIRQVHTTWRFRPEEAFHRFGAEMRAWRREMGSGGAPGGTEDVVSGACKQLAVRCVGAWLMSPRETEIWVGEPPEDRLEGARVLGHQLWELPVPTKQHPSAALPAGIMTIGTVQAWSGWLLGLAQDEGAQPVYWHTDGGAFRAVPPVVRLVERAAREGADVGFPEPERWRFRSLKRLQVWAPSQRHEVSADGAVRVAGSGISRDLSEAEVLGRSELAKRIAALDLGSAGRRAWSDPPGADGKARHATRAPRMQEIDPSVHEAACRAVGRAAEPTDAAATTTRPRSTTRWYARAEASTPPEPAED